MSMAGAPGRFVKHGKGAGSGRIVGRTKTLGRVRQTNQNATGQKSGNRVIGNSDFSFIFNVWSVTHHFIIGPNPRGRCSVKRYGVPRVFVEVDASKDGEIVGKQ